MWLLHVAFAVEHVFGLSWSRKLRRASIVFLDYLQMVAITIVNFRKTISKLSLVYSSPRKGKKGSGDH